MYRSAIGPSSSLLSSLPLPSLNSQFFPQLFYINTRLFYKFFPNVIFAISGHYAKYVLCVLFRPLLTILGRVTRNFFFVVQG